jgi:hypothetical protein
MQNGGQLGCNRRTDQGDSGVTSFIDRWYATRPVAAHFSFHRRLWWWNFSFTTFKHGISLEHGILASPVVAPRSRLSIIILVGDVRRTDREGTGSLKLAMRELHAFFIYRQTCCTCVQAASSQPLPTTFNLARTYACAASHGTNR